MTKATVLSGRDYGTTSKKDLGNYQWNWTVSKIALHRETVRNYFSSLFSSIPPGILDVWFAMAKYVIFIYSTVYSDKSKNNKVSLS